ncbi:uncharacterized protein VP01_895g1, partial [Puccinia sorghi]
MDLLTKSKGELGLQYVQTLNWHCLHPWEFHLIQIALGTDSIGKAFILTDNKGVLQRLSDPKAEKTGQYLFLEICDAWRNLPGDIDIHLVWCPGHQGIVGREAANLLANEAARRNDHPDRRLWANVNKLSSALKKKLFHQDKKSRRRHISELPIAFSAVIN